MQTVWIYEKGEDLIVFATLEAAQAWFDKNDPEGVAFFFRKHLEQILQLTVDRRRDVLLEQFLHPGRRELPVDARPQCGDRGVIRCLVSAEGDRVRRVDHGFLTCAPLLI